MKSAGMLTWQGLGFTGGCCAVIVGMQLSVRAQDADPKSGDQQQVPQTESKADDREGRASFGNDRDEDPAGAFCLCARCEHMRHVQMRRIHRSMMQGRHQNDFRRSGGRAQATVQDVFLEIDASDDGKVTRDEILEQFQRLDANNDKEVTRAELQQHLKQLHEKESAGRARCRSTGSVRRHPRRA